jgi:peptidoglycan hydrolase CwlO-like protein
MVSYTTIVLPDGQTRTVEVPEPKIITTLKPNIKITGEVKMTDNDLIIKCMRDKIVSNDNKIIELTKEIENIEKESKDIKKKIEEIVNEGLKK